MKTSKQALQNTVLTILTSVFAAVLCAERSDYFKERNDTAAYFSHFRCVTTNDSLSDCNYLLSTNGTEFLYQGFVYILRSFFFLDDFYYFKLIFALAIFSTIIYSVTSVSSRKYLSIFILLMDFRFWEYGANSLRNGLAVSLGVIFFLFFARSKTPYWPRLTAILAHSSATLLAIIPRKKMNATLILTISALFITAFFVLKNDPTFLLLSGSDKLQYYLTQAESSETSTRPPLAYALVLTYSLLTYSKKTNSIIEISAKNALFIIFGFSLLFSIIDMAYRVYSFATPFIAILWPALIRDLNQKLRLGTAGKFVTLTASLLIFALAFLNNYPTLSMHLA